MKRRFFINYKKQKEEENNAKIKILPTKNKSFYFDNSEKESPNKKDENFSFKKISIIKTTKEYVKTEKDSDSLMDDNQPKLKKFFSSRFIKPKIETSPKIKEDISDLKENESKIHSLSSNKSFDKYKIKSEREEKNINEKEEINPITIKGEKYKFKGLLKIIEGINNYHKKQAYEETKPKISKYLFEIVKKEKLKIIVNNKIKIINFILKKSFFKWYTKSVTMHSIIDREKEKKELEKKEYENLKTKIFLRRIENVKNKQKKFLLRKYFYRYLKIVLLLGKQEEHQKVIDIYKNDYYYNSEQNYFEKGNLTYYSKSKNKKNNNKIVKLNNISDNLEACKILEKYTWRETQKYILQCFKKKLYSKIIIIYLKKLIKLKEKNIQNIIKKYFEKWKNKTFKKMNNDLKSKMFLKIIKLIIDNNTKKLLSKKLYQWMKIVNILNGHDNAFLKSKITYEFFVKIKKFINKKYSYFFFNRLKLLKKQNHINQLLKKIINNQENKRKFILLNYINKWKRKISEYKIGQLKGKLLLKIYDNYKVNKIKEIIRNKLLKWENNTIFIKITNKINKENIYSFTLKNNKDKSMILLKSIIRNLNRKSNDILLRKYFNKWKKNVKDKNKILEEAVFYLLKFGAAKNGKYFFKKLKDNKKRIELKKIIIKYGKSNRDIINYYFKRWIYITKSIDMTEKANIIQEFCKVRLKNRLGKNKWRKLYLLLKNKEKKNNIKDILKILKYYIAMKKLNISIKKNTKQKTFNTLKKLKNTKKINNILIELIEILDTKYNNNLLKRYLLKWNNKIRSKNNKESALEYMMNILEKNLTKNSLNSLNNVFLLNKLLKDIQKVRALDFLRKLKKEGKNNNLYKNLVFDLVETQDDLLFKNRHPIIDKILRIYTYKILSNLFDYLEKFKVNKIRPNMEDFFGKLYKIKMETNEYNYVKEITIEKYSNILKGMNFHLKSNSKKKRDEKDNKTIIYQQLVPFLIKYLNKLFKYKKNDIFDIIKYNTNGDKFCKLYKLFSKKTEVLDKEDLIDNLKYNIYMKYTKNKGSNKLYYLIRRAIIRKIYNISKTTGNICKMLYLVKITITHSKIKNDRWLLGLIKRWRFITFVRKMALKKMELIYKDLHVTYLDMADNVLNEGSPLGPYGSRFLPDIKIDKYLFDFNDPLLLKGSDIYKDIKKQYVFKPLDIEFEQKTKIIKKEETIDKIKEINKTYYGDYNNSDFKKGKFYFEKNNQFIENAKKHKYEYQLENEEGNNFDNDNIENNEDQNDGNKYYNYNNSL